MLTERVDSRVLGALQIVDRVTQVPVARWLQLESPGVGLVRNRRGIYVITRANGLEAYTASFEAPPAQPAPGSVQVSFAITDPQARYLPRIASVLLPRDPDRSSIDDPESLFRPAEIAMYPAASAIVSNRWSSLRVSVFLPGGEPVAGALVRLFDAEDDRLLASGVSDPRGEALVIVPGVPVTLFADGVDSTGAEDDRRGGRGRGRGGGQGGGNDNAPPPVVVNSLPVRLELSMEAGAPWPVDPDRLETNHAANRLFTTDLSLSTGRMERVVIELT